MNIVSMKNPDKEVIKVIENLLQRAKEGDIKAIAYVVMTDNGEVGSAWEGAIGSKFPIGYGIALLQHRYFYGQS